jgi:integrase/recombinase XerD
MLKAWLTERAGDPTDPLFPTTTGKHLSRDAIERRLIRHLAIAAASCPSLKTKHITMHTLRHYVDGWVMWPAGVFPLLGLARASVPAT